MNTRRVRQIREFCLRPYTLEISKKFFIYGIILAIVLRCGLLYEESKDYVRHLEPWYDFIAENGGLAALKSDFSNYTPAYQYWLVIASSWLGWIPKVIAIKLLAIAFDFICAYFVYKLVQLKYPQGRQALSAFLVVLFTPTVFLNSSFWGQCDSIYTTGLVACVYLICIHQEWLAMVGFGIGFAFKQQAIFLGPFLLILTLKRRLPWLSLLLIPLTYLIFAIPAWTAGRPLRELLLVYANQATQYRHLTANAPTLYKLLPYHERFYTIWFGLGLTIASAMILYFIYRTWRSSVILTPKRIITLALISVLVIPFFLPKMHDRYFFPADVLAIPFGFYYPRLYWITIAIELASFFSYLPRLWDAEIIPILLLSLVLGRTSWLMVRHFKKTFPIPALH